MLHPKEMCPICLQFLSRHAKSSPLLGRSVCTWILSWPPSWPGLSSILSPVVWRFPPGLASAWPGLAWPRKTWLRISRARNRAENEQDPRRCSTRKKCARFVSSFSRDTRNPQPFLALPYVRSFSPWPWPWPVHWRNPQPFLAPAWPLPGPALGKGGGPERGEDFASRARTGS